MTGTTAGRAEGQQTAVPSSESVSAGSLASLDQNSSTVEIGMVMPIPTVRLGVLSKKAVAGRGDFAPKETFLQHLETFWVVTSEEALLQSNGCNARMLLTSDKAEGTP